VSLSAEHGAGTPATIKDRIEALVVRQATLINGAGRRSGDRAAAR
jgi:hypothetical protein